MENFTLIQNEIIRSNKLDVYQKSCINNMLSNEENFKMSLKNLSDRIPCSQRKVQQVIKSLKDINILYVYKVKSLSGDWDSNKYSINMKALLNYIGVEHDMPKVEHDMPNGIAQYAQQVEHDVPTKNTNKNINKNIYISIINYLNLKAGTNFKSTTKATRELIDLRVKDGFESGDFFKVIDVKCGEWLENKEMVRYLRPETLFGDKFESYLNQSKEVKQVSISNNGIRSFK